MTLTLEQKTYLYLIHSYQFDVPPVCHARWDTQAWIRWIDSNGRWIIPAGFNLENVK